MVFESKHLKYTENDKCYVKYVLAQNRYTLWYNGILW